MKTVILGCVIALVMAFAAQTAAADPGDWFGTPNPASRLEPSASSTPAGTSGKTGDSRNTGVGSTSSPGVPLPDGMPEVPSAPSTTAIPIKPPGQVKAKVSCKRVGHGHKARLCRYYVGGKLVRSCTTRGKIRTCYFYSATGRKTRVCTKRGHKKQHCKILPTKHTSTHKHKKGSSKKARAAAELLSDGSYNPGFRTLVHFYCNNNCAPRNAHSSYCSGTLIGKGIVLTAGHCLYANGTLGQANDGFYVPAGNMIVTPGVDDRNLADYGNWGVSEQYANPAWQNGDITQDWGIVVLRPQNGKYAGDYTGTWDQVWWGANIVPGQVLWSLGYPSTAAFNTSQFSFGNQQRFCLSRTTLGTIDDPAGVRRWSMTRDCPMGQGSSGGPVYANINGRWYIVGVNNTAHLLATGFATDNTSVWMDNRFASWYGAVLADVKARGL